MASIPVDQLAALAAIMREGSFDRAARSLHVTPSAISQRIKLLEEHLGQVLVMRGAPCTLTEAGGSVLRHALQLELLERDLLETLKRSPDGDGGTVRVALAVNADSLATWVMPALTQLGDAGIELEVIRDDQNHSLEWLRSGRVLGAITADARPVQGCKSIPLGRLRYRATATPRFFKLHFGKRVTADALARAPAIGFDRKDELQHMFIRSVFKGREAALPMHYLPSPNAILDATLRGLGWSMNPELLARAQLGSGKLVDLVPGKWTDIALYWQQWSLSSATLDKVAAALTTEAQGALLPPD